MKKILALALCCLSMLCMTGCGEKEILEESAVPVINQIVQENLGEYAALAGIELAECISVSLDNQVSDDKWAGTAYFDNGKSADCTVEDIGNDQIYVTLDFDSLR